MDNNEYTQMAPGYLKSKKLKSLAAVVVGGISVNVALSSLAAIIDGPLYLDSVGTILASIIGGYIPGILVGILTNILKQFTDETAIFYGGASVLFAVCTTFFYKRFDMTKIRTLLIYILCLGLIGGGMGGILTWFMFEHSSKEAFTGLAGVFSSMGFARPLALISQEIANDMLDKFISVSLAVIMLRFIPSDSRKKFHFDGWQQAALTREQKRSARHIKCRNTSIRTKIICLLMIACGILGIAALSISTYLYRSASIDEHITLGKSTASLVASAINGDRVQAYLDRGLDAGGYTRTMSSLYTIMESSEDIEFIYAYRIEKDGCHVVFDLDPEGFGSTEADTVIPFSREFKPYIPRLLKGKPIEPIVTDSKSYGWLLTVYAPVYDSNGHTVCYAGVDISMNRIRDDEYTYFARLLSLSVQVLVFVLAFGFWFAEYNIVLPVNTMAQAASSFAYNSETERYNSMMRLKSLKIHTGDELENLYKSLLQTTAESSQFVNDVQSKTRMIEKMQNGLIFVLADIVESRDHNTGQHVKKTAAYVKIIMEQMKKEGIYADRLTDGFVSDVANFAPLHDIGKINIPDAILNKPGRLTKEEFDRMKGHTTAGREIISQVIQIVPESDYLNEARNLAAHHHERWDGTGYPDGLAGEEIPLSARIMAVADVFDALISKRSYKMGFSFSKSISIIEESIGTQFDPLVAKAFLDAKEEVFKVAKEFGEAEDEYEEEGE